MVGSKRYRFLSFLSTILAALIFYWAVALAKLLTPMCPTMDAAWRCYQPMIYMGIAAFLFFAPLLTCLAKLVRGSTGRRKVGKE